MKTRIEIIRDGLAECERMVTAAAATLGRKGGKAGRGASKARAHCTPEHMRAIRTRAKPWHFRVVKRQRGMQGQWFDYPAAATFTNETDARKYAERFAAEQQAAGVVGTAIDIRSRKAIEGGGHVIATYHVR